MHLRSLQRAFGAVAVPALALVLSVSPAPAQTDPNADPGVEPDVARVSVVEGNVDVKRGDSTDTYAATVNAPLSSGDYVTTSANARADLQFDYGTELRVAPDTQLRFTQLDPNAHQLQLAQGTVELRVFRRLDAHAQIETPQATVRPTAAGRYIVAVDQAGNAQITVRSGRADVVTSTGTQSLVPGTTLAVSGDENDAQTQAIDSVSYGDFERWNERRDQYIAQAGDVPYTDAGMVGAEDLPSYGRWDADPQYGNVWIPNVAAGWAPYQDGRWVWEPYYGWTWVAAEPWGWAPFHYGNWFHTASYGWAWYPGTYAAARPYVYRPALVAFFNFGGGDGLSLGLGNIGWVPVAPFEPFHPWWHGYGATTVVNNTYVNTTIVNNVNITKVYRNANVPGGVVAVRTENFSAGNFRHTVALDPSQLRSVRPVRGVLPVVPTTHNLGYGHGAVVDTPIASRFERFTTQPRAVPSFAHQQSAIRDVTARAYRQSDAAPGPARGTGDAPFARFDRGASERTVGPYSSVRPPTAQTQRTYESPATRSNGVVRSHEATDPLNFAQPVPARERPTPVRDTLRPSSTVPSYAQPGATTTLPQATAPDGFGRFRGNRDARRLDSTQAQTHGERTARRSNRPRNDAPPPQPSKPNP